MSLIQCTNDCKFQKDGYCNLEKAGLLSDTSCSGEKKDCLYYQARQPQTAAYTPQEPGRL
ncbi:hypothetical protein [Ethanoligenens harbinense]|uniref:DUF1540 domain-containing protein n=1 Tax=Ethanoligenens harbinense (strain DSM 18485 / JCM 12961 / CGMCC 1.5033 / YUAN-3) TaxID=663278 RepID=E6U6X8_ETHHY|nr:hypothetical protein [Ethanoligenens harbinense]ADU26945.1 hypothetical protein Ethha_1408 [Ethanoligenens harbinense YUAN-3]AVQ96038.1 hypothetical protein CXQ68_07255 [Ethanoligenens harbinense YUAN-3]AYF38699.1 hypothetical protein CXP51_07125 [Ethanoligenens harbinense]AYF41446.1 hypothetical protein CN246_07265 [Ethanoligenens harbinense]QCN92280.1 hypothetical protein DRA42_07285 [Ethanoligenens harbinense]